MVSVRSRSTDPKSGGAARSRLLALPALLLFSPAAAGAEAGAPPPSTAELEIAVINGVYTELDGGLAPIEQGPVTMLVSSPEHELAVHTNKLTLTRRDDGLVDAAFEAQMEGWGQLVVTLKTAGGESVFEDRVEAGRQWLKAAGTVRLETAEGGYLATFIELLYDSIGIQIESQLATQVVEACRAMVGLGFIVLDCEALQARMTRIEVPLPEPGSQFLIRAELLTEHEREVLGSFADTGD